MQIGWLFAGLVLLLETCHVVEGATGVLTYVSDGKNAYEEIAHFSEEFNEKLLDKVKENEKNGKGQNVNLANEFALHMSSAVVGVLPRLESLNKVPIPITAPRSRFMKTLFAEGGHSMAKTALEYAFANAVGGYINSAAHYINIKRATDPEEAGPTVWEYDLGDGWTDSLRHPPAGTNEQALRDDCLSLYEAAPIKNEGALRVVADCIFKVELLDYLRQWQTSTNVIIRRQTQFLGQRSDASELNVNDQQMETKRKTFLDTVDDLLHLSDSSFATTAYIDGMRPAVAFGVIVEGYVAIPKDFGHAKVSGAANSGGDTNAAKRGRRKQRHRSSKKRHARSKSL